MMDLDLFTENNPSYPEEQFKQYLLDDPTYTISFDSLYLEAGETVVRENQELDNIYIVASGSVVEKQNGNTIHILGKNECIGLGAITSQKIATSNFTARTKTKIYKLDAQDVLNKLQQRTYGMAILADLLSARIAVFATRLATIEHENPSAKEITNDEPHNKSIYPDKR